MWKIYILLRNCLINVLNAKRKFEMLLYNAIIYTNSCTMQSFIVTEVKNLEENKAIENYMVCPNEEKDFLK